MMRDRKTLHINTIQGPQIIEYDYAIVREPITTWEDAKITLDSNHVHGTTISKCEKHNVPAAAHIGDSWVYFGDKKHIIIGNTVHLTQSDDGKIIYPNGIVLKAPPAHVFHSKQELMIAMMRGIELDPWSTAFYTDSIAKAAQSIADNVDQTIFDQILKGTWIK